MLFSSLFFKLQVSSFYCNCLRGIVLLLSSESHPILSSSCSILVNCSSKFLVLEGVGFNQFFWFQLYTFHSFFFRSIVLLSLSKFSPSSQLHVVFLVSLFNRSAFKLFLIICDIFRVFATFYILWSHSFVKSNLAHLFVFSFLDLGARSLVSGGELWQPETGSPDYSRVIFFLVAVIIYLLHSSWHHAHCIRMIL